MTIINKLTSSMVCVFLLLTISKSISAQSLKQDSTKIISTNISIPPQKTKSSLHTKCYVFNGATVTNKPYQHNYLKMTKNTQFLKPKK